MANDEYEQAACFCQILTHYKLLLTKSSSSFFVIVIYWNITAQSKHLFNLKEHNLLIL